MPVKIKIDDPVKEASLLLHQVAFSIDKIEDKSFRRVGISPSQYSVIAAIRHIKDPVTPTNVANWLDRNTNSITLMIDRLEREGLVTRSRDLNDRRSLRLSLTEKGMDAFKRGAKPRAEIPQEAMSCLSPGEVQELNRSVSKILEKTYEMRNLQGKVTEENVADL